MSDNGVSIGSASRAVARPANVASGRPLSAPARAQATDGNQAQTSNVDTRVSAASPPSASQPGVPVEALRATTSPSGQAFSEQAQFFAEQGLPPRRRGSVRDAGERSSRGGDVRGNAAAAGSAFNSDSNTAAAGGPAGARQAGGARPFQLPQVSREALASLGREEAAAAATRAASPDGVFAVRAAEAGLEQTAAVRAERTILSRQVAVGFGRAGLLSGEVTIVLAEARVDAASQSVRQVSAGAAFGLEGFASAAPSGQAGFGSGPAGGVAAPRNSAGTDAFSAPAFDEDFEQNEQIARRDDVFAGGATSRATAEEAALVSELVANISSAGALDGENILTAVPAGRGDAGELAAGVVADTSLGGASEAPPASRVAEDLDVPLFEEALRAGEAVSRRVLEEQASNESEIEPESPIQQDRQQSDSTFGASAGTPSESGFAPSAAGPRPAFSQPEANLSLGFISEAIRQYQAVSARLEAGAFR